MMFSDLPDWTISLGICAFRTVMRPDLRGEVSASDHERLLVTRVNGPLTVAVTGSTGAHQNVGGQLTVEPTLPHSTTDVETLRLVFFETK